MKIRYKKNPDLTITAVQINLDMQPLTYIKWGGEQVCKPGDWVVNNNGETYTIDAESFDNTYAQVSPGVYFKIGNVWAEVATEDGHVSTKEGKSEYQAGDYLVCNDEDDVDTYCIPRDKFESMYVAV